MTDKKISRLDRQIEELKEDYGKDILDTCEEKKSWGSASLDQVLGGLPNRIVQLYGKEGAGKSTLALLTIANEQKKGKRCAYIDSEFGYSTEYAASLGVDTQKLLVVQKCIMEDIIDIVIRLVMCSDIGIIVLDSLPALVPKIVEEDFVEKQDLTKKHVADRARLMSEALNLITGYCKEYGNTFIIINQLREKIGILFGNPKTIPGGKALKHYSSQMVEIIPAKKIEKIVKGITYTVGRELIIVADKNKISPPLIQCHVPIIFGKGLQEHKAEFHKLSSEELDKIFKEE